MAPDVKTDAVRPETLEIFVGGLRGHSYGVRWRNGFLYYEEFSGFCELKGAVPIEPSTDAWQRFWAACDAIDVWRWAASYAASHTDPAADQRDPASAGANWSMQIAVGGKRAASSGRNAYPPDGSPEPTPAFQRLCEAVSALAGGQSFG